MQSDKCIFCKIARKDIPAKIVYEDDQVLAFEDAKPQAPVHVLIIPHDHIEKVSDLKEKDALIAGKVIMAAKNIARSKGLDDSGYRIVMNCNRDAGQEVFHVHAHLMGGRKFNWPPG